MIAKVLLLKQCFRFKHARSSFLAIYYVFTLVLHIFDSLQRKTINKIECEYCKYYTAHSISLLSLPFMPLVLCARLKLCRLLGKNYSLLFVIRKCFSKQQCSFLG